jgi:hypothetical protein
LQGESFGSSLAGPSLKKMEAAHQGQLPGSPTVRALRWPTFAGARMSPILILLISLAAGFACGQEPPAASNPAPANQQPAPPTDTANSPANSSSSKHSHSHAADFLIIGTVFTDRAMAFPGVHLRVRRASEKKFRWETYTNSRGEFAIRVPQGAEYEMVILAKGFIEQTSAISAKSGISEDSVVFRMQPAAGGKK